MVKSMLGEKAVLKKGPWTREEDEKLMAYIQQHGHGSWCSLPAKAGTSVISASNKIHNIISCFTHMHVFS